MLSPHLSWSSRLASVIPCFGLEDPVTSKYTTIIYVMSHHMGVPHHGASIQLSDDLTSICERTRYSGQTQDVDDNYVFVVPVNIQDTT